MLARRKRRQYLDVIMCSPNSPDSDVQLSTPPPPPPPPKRNFLVWAISGIVSIVYAVQANSAYDAGNFAEHARLADKAKFWLILGTAVAVVLWVLYFLGLVAQVVLA